LDKVIPFQKEYRLRSSSDPFDGFSNEPSTLSQGGPQSVFFLERNDLIQSAMPRSLASPYLSSAAEAELPVCPLHWARPIHKLNCGSTLIWPRFLSEIPPHSSPTPPTPAPELVELDTPEYAGRIRKELVIEKLLAMAGVRLAAVLNELLDPEGIVDHGRVPDISFI